MTSEELAALHAQCFATPRPWSAEEFAALQNLSGVLLLTSDAGFLLGRVVVDEAEILTIAVSPDARRRGIGRDLIERYEEAVSKAGARMAFLEVAADNLAAQALYGASGYRESGRRRGYYSSPEGQRIDALILSKALKNN